MAQYPSQRLEVIKRPPLTAVCRTDRVEVYGAPGSLHGCSAREWPGVPEVDEEGTKRRVPPGPSVVHLPDEDVVGLHVAVGDAAPVYALQGAQEHPPNGADKRPPAVRWYRWQPLEQRRDGSAQTGHHYVDAAALDARGGHLQHSRASRGFLTDKFQRPQFLFCYRILHSHLDGLRQQRAVDRSSCVAARQLTIYSVGSPLAEVRTILKKPLLLVRTPVAHRRLWSTNPIMSSGP
mmetsp:Transcript_59699/g.134558  ORF Transcript_59699/g.134558 Transcript_59699/m.134558 type:complete len:235 (+) Transcript_59699:452-1156(+)